MISSPTNKKIEKLKDKFTDNNKKDKNEEEKELKAQLEEVKLLRGLKHMLQKLNNQMKEKLINTEEELSILKNKYKICENELENLKKISTTSDNENNKTITELQNHINLLESKFDKQEATINILEDEKQNKFNDHILLTKKYNENKEMCDELIMKNIALEKEIKKLSAVNLTLHSKCTKAGLISTPLYYFIYYFYRKDINPESLTTEYPFVMKVYQERDLMEKKLKKMETKIIAYEKQLENESKQRKRLWEMYFYFNYK